MGTQGNLSRVEFWLALEPSAKTAMSEVDCCWSILFQANSWSRENEIVGKCSIEKPKSYNCISEVTYHYFCHVLWSHSPSLAQSGKGLHRVWTPAGGDQRGPSQRLPTQMSVPTITTINHFEKNSTNYKHRQRSQRDLSLFVYLPENLTVTWSGTRTNYFVLCSSAKWEWWEL